MSHGGRSSTGARRGLFLTLALMALVMRVMIPGGFMMAATPTGAFAMVICSADPGRTMSVDWADAEGKQKPSDAQSHDSPCVFAGHGLADAPPLSPVIQPETRFVATPQPVRPAKALIPGRGLAAPPPPSTGPPVLSI